MLAGWETVPVRDVSTFNRDIVGRRVSGVNAGKLYAFTPDAEASEASRDARRPTIQ